MSTEIKVPVLPESVQDATIATWHKTEGEQVKRDELLADIETDKVMLEVVAPSDGVLSKILHPVGAVVKAEEKIAEFEAGAENGNADNANKEAAAEKATANQASLSETSNTLSPSARRAAREQQLNSATAASGSSVTESHTGVNSFLDQSLNHEPTPKRESKRVKMTRLRAKIAERLLSAKNNAAILTTFNEINMGPVIQLRAKYRDQFEQKYGVRLGLMSFFVTAVVSALKKFPMINASIDNDDIVYHGFYDVGIAVASERGLVVPVLRNADNMNMAEIEQQIKDYGERAKAGKLGLDELTGGTFTVTNGGVFGSLMSTPIINPPQSAILGMHKIEERPIVENKEIKIRPMMYVALSYDHRLIDGAESVQFLVNVKELLEDPARLLLSI